MSTRYTLSVEAVYRFGHNGDAAALVAADLRKDAAESRKSLAGPRPAWHTEAKRALIADSINRREQAAAVIDRLMRWAGKRSGSAAF